jgi:hypothetical protein
MTGRRALALFILFAILHTWPLATNPGHLSRNDNGDTVLIEWTLAWVAHQTFVDPVHLFEGNIFYPSHNTLAFSEHLFALGMMAAPLFWLGASPVLAYNLLLIAGFALSGWSLALLLHRWTGDWLAGIFAGTVLAFNTHTLTRLPHLHAVHFEFLPPLLLVLDMLLREPRPRHGLLLAMWFLLMSLTSNYHMVFALAALAAALLCRPADWLNTQRGPRILAALAVAGAIAAVGMFPFLWPYLQVAREYGHVRSLEEVAMYTAGWDDYLASASRLHYALWSAPFYHRSNLSLFPGVVPIVLALIALGTGVAWKDRRARMFLAIGIAGLLLSFGTALPGYTLLYDLIPILHGIRGANRFGFLVIVAIATLGGFALASLRTRFAGRRWILPLTIAAIVAAHVEALRAPFDLTWFEGMPGIYELLRDQPHAVVAEFPFDDPQHTHESSYVMLYSTLDWHPRVNGHSAFIPRSYRDLYPQLTGFPDVHALDALRAAGVTHVVVHHHRFGPMPNPAPGLDLIARGKNISLYELNPPTAR